MTHLDDSSAGSRQRWVGRVAALFFAGGGTLGLATLPLAPPDSDVAASAIIAALAIVTGWVVWAVRWERLPRRATLVVVPPALALIAAGNVYGGTDYFSYGIFFVIAFVWIGLAHPPWTCVAFAPLAFLAYLVPLATLPESDVASGVGSALLVVPISVLVGESLARGLDRLARTEAELRRQRALAEELRALDEMKTAFMRAASHELRTPLTVCRGHLEVLGPDPDSEELRRTVDLVTDELGRMGRLVEDVTTLTRLEDPTALRREAIEVAELVGEIAEKSRPLLEAPLRVATAPPGSVIADRDRLTQALLNLLANAAAHGGPGTDVELRASQERGAWMFVVSNDGRGIAEGEADALFEPFTHDATSAGSGLGLAIVRAIARAHGGTVGGGSGERSGAEFWIRTPS